MRCNWGKFALLLHFLIFATIWAPLRAEENGEAKKSRLNAMKKVEDGNPILRANMMNHIMQAQMYRAQMNFPMAAEEDMKAQMLKQQIDQNDSSKDKNEKQKDDVIYTSDAAQKQMRMEAGIPSMQAPGGRPEAVAAKSEWGLKQNELLNFDEGISKQKAPASLQTEGAALVLPDAPETPAGNAPTATANASPSPLETSSNKVLSAGLMQAFQQIEQNFQAQQPNATPTGAADAGSTDAPQTAPAELTTGFASLSKVQLSDEMKKLNAKKDKERESFWKTKKSAKKKTSHRGAKRRAVAKKKTKEIKKAALSAELEN